MGGLAILMISIEKMTLDIKSKNGYDFGLYDVSTNIFNFHD